MRNKDGWTPLHFAADEGAWSVVEFLLDHCSDISLRSTKTSMTPLDLAQFFRQDSYRHEFRLRPACLAEENWSNEAIDILLTWLGQTSSSLQ